MKTSSPDTKLAARHAIGAFGAPPNVWQFACEKEGLSIDIGGCADRPLPGIFSYTTIGLSEFELGESGEMPTCVELVSACASDRPFFPNILAAAAMQIVRRGESVKPGDAVQNVIAEYYPRATVSHLYLTRPFLWSERMREFQGETKCVAWLLAVPVTSGELLFLETQGDAGLEELYRQRKVDMYSLGRPTWV